jgi:oligosaccharide repeat unit polymerase
VAVVWLVACRIYSAGESMSPLIPYGVAAVVLAIVSIWSGRSLHTAMSPGALFAALWCVLLVVLIAAGDSFYRVPSPALVIFVLGAVAFSGGAVVAKWLPRATSPGVTVPADDRYFLWLLIAGIAVLAASFPFYVHYAQELAQVGQGAGFLYSVRRGSVILGDRPVSQVHYTLGYVWLINLPNLALMFTLTALAECRQRRALRWPAAVAALLYLSYAVLTASIGPFVALAAGVIGIAGGQLRRIPVSLLLTAGVLVVAGLMGMAIATRKEGTMVGLLVLYLVGGLVAFGATIEHPGVIPANWSIWRFFTQTLDKFGEQYVVPSLHLPYVNVRPATPYNAYTMYFAYFPHYGYAGVVLLCLCAGLVCGYVFLRARQGSRPWQIGYGVAVLGILLSGKSEHFWMSLNFTLKAAAFLIAVYGAPHALRAFRHWAKHPAEPVG